MGIYLDWDPVKYSWPLNNVGGVSAPNPHIVQGPTVFMYPDPKKYYILYGL